MRRTRFAHVSMAAAAATLALIPSPADAQSRVQYGRITNVTATTVTDSSSQAVGTIVGGAVGLASGRGQSGSNRALRGVGGAAAGRGVGTVAGRSQAFEYTVLINGKTTIRVISDQVGKRIGDCVAVEQGQFSNIRLVPDDRCTTAAAARPATPAPTPASGPTAEAPARDSDVQAANACDQAKEQVLSAETDEAFSIAERRMRLLCGE
jgi:outer membrane lipoprotein SlyB